VHKPGSKQIINNSVRSKDLHNHGIHAIDLQKTARGPAIAGVEVRSNGVIVNWFNRAGGKPSISEHLNNSGEYTITFPGVKTLRTLVSLASGGGRATRGPLAGLGANSLFVRKF